MFLRLLAAIVLLVGSPALLAETAYCHYRYGGEAKTVAVAPGGDPYRAPALPIGSFFRFRVVIEETPAALAALKTYVYALQDSGPALVHQASYPWPVVEGPAERHGFSGLQRVYAPGDGAELEYWCSVVDSGEGLQ